MPYNSRKISRERRESGEGQKSRPRKRKNVFNPKTAERDETASSASAKKLKRQEDVAAPMDHSMEYRILNFFVVFSAISSVVKCKTCDGNIKFQTASTRGLGFKVVVLCDNCPSQYIPSCPFVGHSYEINRRIIFVMRTLGVGYKGLQKFCGLMDFPQFLDKNTYQILLKAIRDSCATVSEIFMKNAVIEEVKETCKAENLENTTELTVSGDGTWQKRGYTSLYGVFSLIGHYSGKVVDIIVKSGYCKQCEFCKSKLDTQMYEEWYDEHKISCLANHEGSAGKMEVDGIVEMFKQSQEKYNVKYVNYIGDGDSKTYKGIVDAAPYGETAIIKKECVGHVQKRMGSRLRDCKKRNKGLGGKGKLTGKMIDKLSVYYGLAIRRNCNSLDGMKDAIWATFYHYSSIAKNQEEQHSKYPKRADSWCEYQRAKASNELDSYQQSYTSLPADVLEAIRPIYDDLSKTELLQRCIGGFTQKNNESLNNLIWKIAPKTITSSSVIVEIAAFVGMTLFNEGMNGLLVIMNSIGITCGVNAHYYAQKEENERIALSNQRAEESTREARILRRQQQAEDLEAAMSVEGVLYGPGVDDTV
ncbi:LOW QUALITY PROTEIN: uncharacterized protein [Prorops nasuta]|uniref:LOW QUALITY PROTEIN: uncharacterized protein n=1 Tax=Prorops nasuta TaxID=863751 RepID=UPI0034CD6462